MARHYNAQDFRGGELRNFKVHIYPDMAAANADVASATARIIYVSEQGMLYGGIPGAWIPIGSPDAIQNLMAVGSNYQLALADLGKLVVLTGAAPFTFTLPAQATTALPAGSRVILVNTGTAAVTVVAASGTIAGPATVAPGQFTELVLLEAGATNQWASLAYLVATPTADGLMSASDKAKLDGIVAGAGVPVNADWNATTGLAEILNKPASFPPDAHGHAAATDVAAGFMAAADKAKLDGIAAGAGVQVNSDWNAGSGVAQILNKPATMPPTAHGHPISEIPDLQTTLDGKSIIGHGHAITDVTGLQDALDDKSDVGHGHAISDVTGLQDALDDKSDVGHGHAISDVTGLQDALDDKQDAITDILSLTPRTDDPASPTNGQIWLNSTAGKLRCRIGGVTVDLN